MGANAAWMVLQALDNAFDIAAVLALAVSQAVEAAGASERLSSRSRALIAQRREIAPVFRIDTPLSERLAAMSRMLKGEP